MVNIICDDGPTFAELKQNVFFTEKRLALLLESKFHPEMAQWVKEKIFVRTECKNECVVWVEKLEKCITGKMRGLWHAMRIVQAFNVEVNLQSLVGSEWYEMPKTSSTQDAAHLINRIRELGLLVPGNESRIPPAEDVARLTSQFKAIDWSVQDMERFSEALKAKERLLLEVSELTKTLHEVAWGCSIHEAHKEELRRKARESEEHGEMDMYAQFTQEEIDASEALMQLLLFKLQTTESSQAENTLKRRNNVSQWKLAAAQLETLKEHKVERQSECLRDKERIARGLQYEAKRDEDAREDFNKRKKQFEDRLAYLNRNQDELAVDLEELCEKFKVIEDKLASLTGHREEAIKARVEMIETEMQRVADYQEFVECAKKHISYVDSTQRMADESAALIGSLQRFLMNEQEYDGHDFHETTKLLHDTKQQTLRQLNVCYVDYCTRVMRVSLQLDVQIRETEQEASRYQMQAECRKETLNPEAKRYVVAAKEVLLKREALRTQRSAILSKLDFVKNNYLKKVKEELPQHEIVEPDQEIEEMLLNRRDDLLTMREQLVHSAERQILDEREDILATGDKIAEEKDIGANRQVKRERKVNADTLVDDASVQDGVESAAGGPPKDDLPEKKEPRREHRGVAAAHDVRMKTLSLATVDPAATEAPRPEDTDTPARRLLVHDLAVTSTPKTIRPLEEKYGQGLFPAITEEEK